jgi:peptide chain release factor 2
MQDFSPRINALSTRLSETAGYLRVDELRARRPQLETELGRPDLWDDAEAAQTLQREFAELSDDLELFDSLEARVSDVATLHELAREEGDESLSEEIERELGALEREFSRLELRALFTGEYDDRDAIIDVNSGAGGVDAQDFAEMLLRMYQRWAERRGFDVELQSATDGTEAGISSATMLVRGRNAYGLLRSEHGVHRLVRISPFDNNARRQTSFASVKITPFLEDVGGEVEIDDKDLRIDVYRSSGAGGQHVNKTDSAVRLTHLPTGIVVACQNERSQHQNKDRAMKVLKAKLLELEHRKHRERLDEITGEGASVNFGSQDRNYVLQPYQQVKDLRTGLELSNPEAVLDGELDDLMEAFLRWQRSGGEPVA